MGPSHIWGVGLLSLVVCCKMNQLQLFCVLSLTSLFARGQTPNLCPTEPACLGCRTGRRIICSSGGLTSFPNLPPGLQQGVRELRLTNNGLTNVRVEDLANYTSLVTLILSFNNIGYIEPGSLNETRVLREIDLSSNQLVALPDELFVGTQLTSLIVRNNRIESISAATFRGLQDFSTINFDNNFIRTIPDGTFSDIGRTEQLVLTNNPLVCDCHLRWLPHFVSQNSSSSPLISNLGTCTLPVQNATDVTVSTLETDDFECECIPPCINGTCNMISGECECSDGFTSSDCSSACPGGTYGAGCLQNCTCVVEHGSSPCDNVDGTCHCLPGYNGSSCETECQEGFFGYDCEEVCLCQNGAACDFRTGSCDCTTGWTGQLCNTACPNGTYGQNCSQLCMCTPDHESAPCDRTDGTCYCEPGYTGNTCDEECPQHYYGQNCGEECECKNGASCDPITGECTCTSGWLGERCDRRCTAGFYGLKCNQSCSCIKVHQSSPCDVVTGYCYCLANYTGQNCEMPQNTSETNPTRNIIVGALVGSTAAVMTVIAVAVLIIFGKNFLSCHQTRQASVKISPSTQFDVQNQDIKHSLSLPPPNDLIQPSIPKIIITTET